MAYSFPNLEPVSCFMSGSNCCFLTYIQVSQETGKVVWYSHLFKNFPQLVVASLIFLKHVGRTSSGVKIAPTFFFCLLGYLFGYFLTFSVRITLMSVLDNCVQNCSDDES